MCRCSNVRVTNVRRGRLKAKPCASIGLLLSNSTKEASRFYVFWHHHYLQYICLNEGTVWRFRIFTEVYLEQKLATNVLPQHLFNSSPRDKFKIPCQERTWDWFMQDSDSASAPQMVNSRLSYSLKWYVICDLKTKSLLRSDFIHNFNEVTKW